MHVAPWIFMYIWVIYFLKKHEERRRKQWPLNNNNETMHAYNLHHNHRKYMYIYIKSAQLTSLSSSSLASEVPRPACELGKLTPPWPTRADSGRACERRRHCLVARNVFCSGELYTSSIQENYTGVTYRRSDSVSKSIHSIQRTQLNETNSRGSATNDKY